VCFRIIHLAVRCPSVDTCYFAWHALSPFLVEGFSLKYSSRECMGIAENVFKIRGQSPMSLQVQMHFSDIRHGSPSVMQPRGWHVLYLLFRRNRTLIILVVLQKPEIFCAFDDFKFENFCHFLVFAAIFCIKCEELKPFIAVMLLYSFWFERPAILRWTKITSFCALAEFEVWAIFLSDRKFEAPLHMQ